MTALSTHFTLEEMTRSAKAMALGVDNLPDEKSRANLVKLCREILEPLREAYGAPLIISSGYRSRAVNQAVKGSRTSQHITGEAADINLGANNRKLFSIAKKLMDSGRIRVGQLIWEYGNTQNPAWVHVSLPRVNKPNNMVLYYGVKK